MPTIKINKSRSYFINRVTLPQKSLVTPVVEKIAPVKTLVDNTLASKLYHFNFIIYENIRSQENIQDSIAYLDYKEEMLTEIKYLGDNLVYLSNIYSKSSPYSHETDEIILNAKDILCKIEYLTNEIDYKSIKIISSTGRDRVIYSNGLYINLTPSPYITDSKFINNYKPEDLLSKLNVINHSIVDSVKILINECQSYKSILYNQFLEENSIAKYNINPLYKGKNLSEYMWNNLIKIQENLLNTVIGLSFQSDNLSWLNVYELLI